MPCGGERALGSRRRGTGKQVGSPFSCEPLVQVEAAEVEGELEPQHAEEALDVIGRLRERVGDVVDSLPADLLQRLEAALVAVGDREAVAGERLPNGSRSVQRRAGDLRTV